MNFHRAWADEVVAICVPVFTAADVGFESRVYMSGQEVETIFWMANPKRFFQAYPDSAVDERYGPLWPDEVRDIDFTITVESAGDLLQIDVEAWDLPTVLVRSEGDGRVDGVNLARVFARLLGIDQRQLFR